MFEKLRYKNCLKQKSKEFDCREIAKSLVEANSDKASNSDWQLNAASSAVFLSSIASNISTDMKLELGKNLRRFLNPESMKALGENVSAACERKSACIATNISKNDVPTLLDGNVIFEQVSKEWDLPDQLTKIAGSIIGAVLIALIIKVIIWIIVYLWWNKK